MGLHPNERARSEENNEPPRQFFSCATLDTVTKVQELLGRTGVILTGGHQPVLEIHATDEETASLMARMGGEIRKTVNPIAGKGSFEENGQVKRGVVPPHQRSRSDPVALGEARR